jgi:hypothetical protein
MMGGILGTTFDHSGTCLGGILASFGVATWLTKNRKIKSIMALDGHKTTNENATARLN